MAINLILLAVGVALLTVGGEALIRGALAVARRMAVSPLLTGLVIVGFGTSVPELVVSLEAALGGRPGIAVGNVVGSNIANVLLILGLCALIYPLSVQPQVLRRDMVAVLAASFLFPALVYGGLVARWEGSLFFAAFLVYLAVAYRTEQVEGAPAAALHQAEADELEAVPQTTTTILVATLGGLAILIAGSKLTLMGAVGLAERLGVPEAVIGLTLVAVGTSLPELAVTIIAAFRRHADVAVGNVLGSNLFNLLGILGVTALIQPLAVPARIQQLDQWVMVGAAVLLALCLLTGRRISRLEGGVLLAGYCAYIGIGFLSP